MKRRKRDRENGFERWGGYMEAKKSKLIQQFNEEVVNRDSKVNDLFKGVAIFINGYTDPSADELRNLMMKYGGSYHHYYKNGSTTHIIASNLPNSKMKLIQNHKIIKPSWITDSIKANKLLNFKEYLLYSNQSLLKTLFATNDGDNQRKGPIKDTTHEDFISDFYNNSRLHHISVMGTIFKDFINDIRSDKTHQLTGKNELLKIDNFKQNNFTTCLRKNNKFIMHIDMDCFFVSVGLRNKPELYGHPVVVTHSNGNQSRIREGINAQAEIAAYCEKKQNSAKNNKAVDIKPEEHWIFNINELDSMAEIASCSYEARKLGIRNGMFVGQALKLCPDLKFIHYDFDSYKEVSFILYNSVARYTTDIEAVSCDEMYADCTELLKSINVDPMSFATILRNEIKQKTGCPCSVGFGGNRLQARLATKKAKPNGQFYLEEDNVNSFICSLPVSELPGVGGSTNYKLKSMGIKTCGDLQNSSLSALQEELGKKLGETLFKNSFGKDDKPLTYNHIRKSVSADINYGIRFQNDTERDTFLTKLSEEVSNRLGAVKMKGRNITLKLMIRSKDAPEETTKYMGHGVCDQISKGTTLASATSSSSIILREVIKLIKSMNVKCKELRGIGIQISRLESEISTDNKLKQFLNNHKKEDKPGKSDAAVATCSKNVSRTVLNTYEDLSLSQIDQSFFDAMPDNIQKEIISNVKSSRTALNVKEKKDNIDSQQKEREKRESEQENEKAKLEKNDVLDGMKTYITPGELRLLIKQWVETEDKPNNRDTSMITEYLRHLAAADHLEDLLIIIKSFFKYICRNNKSTNWKKAYMEIVDNTQVYIFENYKSKLMIEDIFSFN